MAVFAFVLLLMVALNLVIAHINVTNGDKYAKQVLSQQTYDSRTIPYRRGEILDRNGNVLAKSEKVYNVILDCYAINSMDDYIEPTIAAVSEQFGLDSATVRDVICSRSMKVANEKETIKFRIVMDKYTIEVFANDGKQAMTTLIYTDLKSQGIVFSSDGKATFSVTQHTITMPE